MTQKISNTKWQIKKNKNKNKKENQAHYEYPYYTIHIVRIFFFVHLHLTVNSSFLGLRVGQTTQNISTSIAMVIHQFSTSTSGAHNTVFTRTNAAVFIEFFVLRLLRRLFEGGVYCKVYSNRPAVLIKELPRRKR